MGVFIWPLLFLSFCLFLEEKFLTASFEISFSGVKNIENITPKEDKWEKFKEIPNEENNNSIYNFISIKFSVINAKIS